MYVNVLTAISGTLLTRFLVGGAFIAVGALFVIRPQIVDWLNDQTNLRAARWWEKMGVRGQVEKNAQRQQILRAIMPGLFILFGVFVLFVGFSSR